MRVIRLAAAIVAAALGMALLTASAAPGQSWTIDFEKNLSAGDTPTVLSNSVGVSGGGLGSDTIGVGSDDGSHLAMIFDSDCTGAACFADSDLAVDSGNVLIISADNSSAAPNDFAGAGVAVTFDFSELGTVCIDELTLIDIEGSEPAGTITLDGPALALTVINYATNDDGQKSVEIIDVCGVDTLIWQPNQSGAIDNIEFSADRDFMTGGGNVQEGRGNDKELILSHGFIIRCDGSHANFEYQDHRPGGGNFHLESVTSVECTDDGDPYPPAASFNTLTLTGEGRWNGVSGATVEVTLVDLGQPGTSDTIEILVKSSGGATLSEYGPATLTVGNHQAH